MTNSNEGCIDFRVVKDVEILLKIGTSLIIARTINDKNGRTVNIFFSYLKKYKIIKIIILTDTTSKINLGNDVIR